MTAQECLLRACILDGEAARVAYREWVARIDIDSLDHRAQRLLPMLYRKLQDIGIESPHAGKLKGIYWRTHYHNRLALKRGREVLEHFAAAGVTPRVVRGLAMIVLYYPELGMRPMIDFDVLVRGTEAGHSVEILESAGWRRQPGPAFTDTFFSAHHSWPFRNPDGGVLTLHWRLLRYSAVPDADEDLRQAITPAAVSDYPCLALGVDDALLEACTRAGSDPAATLRCLADTATIVGRCADKLDWVRVARQARRHGVVLPVHTTLAYLREHLEVPVPGTVLTELREAPTTRQQRWEFRWRRSAPRGLHRLVDIWFGYLRDRRARPCGHGPRLLAFGHYLQRRWGTRHLWQVPLASISLLTQELHRGRRAQGRDAGG